MIGSSCGRAHASTAGERDDIVLLAVDHDRVRGDRARRQSAQRRARRGPYVPRCTVAATRVCTNEPNEKPASTTGSVAITALRVRERRERIRGFADAIVEGPFRLADAAKIEAHAGVTQREEGLGKRLHDLVVERAALLRMRMRDQCDAARSTGSGALSAISSAPAGPSMTKRSVVFGVTSGSSRSYP